MIKVETIEYFTLQKFNELENIKRAKEENEGKDGELFVGDTFNCTEEMLDYLTGNNHLHKAVVKIVKEQEINTKDEVNFTNEKELNNEENANVNEEKELENTDENEKELNKKKTNKK